MACGKKRGTNRPFRPLLSFEAFFFLSESVETEDWVSMRTFIHVCPKALASFLSLPFRICCRSRRQAIFLEFTRTRYPDGSAAPLFPVFSSPIVLSFRHYTSNCFLYHFLHSKTETSSTHRPHSQVTEKKEQKRECSGCMDDTRITASEPNLLITSRRN